MAWLLVPLALVVLLVLVVFLVGRSLPADYHGRLTATYDAPPDAVWAAFNDHHTTPVTGSQWKATHDLEDEDGLPAWMEDMGPSQATIRTVEAVEGERLVRAYSDSVVPMTARVEYRFEATEAGTRVVGENHFRVEEGTWHVPLFRFILTVTGGANRSLREYFAGIGRAVEAAPVLE